MKHNDVAAVGVGYSTTGRRTGLSSFDLAFQATQAALADAGMTVADLDGVTVLWGVAGPEPAGLDVVEPMSFAHTLGITPLNFYATAGPAYIGPAIQGINAIRSGMAHTVLTLRIINQRLSTAAEMESMRTATEPTQVGGSQAYTAPYGFSVAGMIPSIASMPARRHMDRYGTTEEMFGTHVLNQRYHASMNPEAIFREPLTMDDYLSSRYIARPVHLLDCDYPVDSASAVIYTADDRAHDWNKPPVWVNAATYSSVGTDFNLMDMNHNSPFQDAAKLWERTDLTPDDVDCAQLYDGFTIIVFQWLEALGFCGEGESGPFVAEGNTRLGGRIPVNTDGGACNVGRRHGANFCIESIRQLRGECGPRQVPDAEVAVWANAVGPFSGAVLMTKEKR
ncbi:MAG: thiolase family protein [Acidimicrobiia bacterium]